MKKHTHIERSQTKIIQQSYHCAGCWNPVIVGFDKAGDFIECETEDCPLPGLVSARWVDKQLSENIAEAASARKVLKDSIEWLNVGVANKLTNEQIMHQLGF